MTEQYDFTQTLNDLDAGIFAAKVSAAVQQVALGVVEHGREGEIVIKLKMKTIGESHQVQLNHSLIYKRPTKRGKKSEEDDTSTALYVGRGGSLSIMPASQTDMFKEPEKGAV